MKKTTKQNKINVFRKSLYLLALLTLPWTTAVKAQCDQGVSMCNITFEMTDSYGDGWNDCSISVYQGTTLRGTVTLSSGSSGEATVAICSGDSVRLVWFGETGWPNYSSEAGFNVINGDGTTVIANQTGGNFSSNSDIITFMPVCPTCIAPSNLTAVPDMNEIQLSWTSNNESSLFILYLNGSVVDNNVTDTFYTFTNLDANTAYTLSVRSVCSADDSSSVASLTARTTCGEITLPFSDDFDSYDNGFWPPCWHRLMNHGTDPSVNNQYQSSGTQSMFLLAQNDTNLFVTPSAIPTSGDNIYVRYKAYCDYSSWGSAPDPWWIKVGVMTDTSDVTTFIMLDSIGYHNSNYSFEEYEFNTSSLNPNATYWVAWMFTSSNSSRRGAIDDVFISEIPSCLRATGTSVTNVTGHTADLSWDDMGVDSYNIYYGTVNNINDDDISMISTYDTAITLTGLSSVTQYYAWVVSVCSGSEAEANSFNSFTTLVSCPAVTNLTIDTFYTDGAIISWSAQGNESEWAVVLDSNDVEMVYDTTFIITGLDPLTGHTLYVRAVCDEDDTSTVSSIDFATACEDGSCLFTVNMTDSFGDGWNGNQIDFYQAGTIIGSATLTSGNSGTESISVCSSASVELRFHTGNYAYEMGGYITDGSGLTIFTISNMGSYSNDALLTSVQVPCPECIMPMNLTLDTASLTTSSASISWEAGSSSSWIILIDSTYINVSDTFYTFNDLEPLSSYTVYVASDCSGDTSSYNSITFSTPCADSTCNMTVEMTDSYGDGWNGNSIEFYQANGLIGSATLASGNSGTETVSVCSSAPVEIRFHLGSYADEMGGTVSDGGGLVVYNIENMSTHSTGDLLATVLSPCPSCMPVSGLRVSHSDSTSITYEWNIVTGNSYLVSFDSSTFVDNSTGSYTATGLQPNTEHIFQIFTICDVDDTSSVSTLISKTTCVMMILPYVENFESYNNGEMPTCWSVVHDYTYNDLYSGTIVYPSVSANGLNNSHALSFIANGTCMAATSAIPNNGWMGDQYHIYFFAKLGSYSNASAGVMTDPTDDNTYTSLATISGDDQWHRYDLYTSGLNPAETYYFAVRYDATYAYSSYALNIDSLVIEIDAGCHFPSNLAVTTTTNSATLNWSNSGVTSDFIVAYRLYNSNTFAYSYVGNANTTTINNLQSSSNYLFRVGNICTNGDTLWTDISALTDCGIIMLPYFENFDAYAEDVLPPCWVYNSAAVTHYDGGLFFRSNTGPSYSAVMPQFDQPVSKTEIEFKAKLGPLSQGDAILVGVADANGNFIQWLDTLTDLNQSRSVFVWMTYRYDDYNGTGSRIALGRLYSGDDWALIDDITVRQIPTCSPADSIIGHNLYDPDSSYFTWSNPDNLTNFQVYVDTVTADTTTIPLNTLTSITDFSYLIPTGILSGGGKYKFFIRSDCGNGYSPWKVVTFGSGEFIMSQSGTDTVTSCGLVIYDNGGPIAGYYSQTSSSLVIYPAGTGNRLQVYGAYLSLYNDGASTLTIYDGAGTNGTVLYQTSYSGPTTMYDSIVTLPLATASAGPLTVSFSAGTYVNPGYELYVRCIPIVSCDDPTYIQANNITATEATLSWYGNANNYNIYYRQYGSSTWSMTTSNTASVTLTGLMDATTYQVQIRAICSSIDSSNLSDIFTFNTNCNVVNIAQGQSLVEDFEGIMVPSTCWQLIYGTNANATDNPVVFDPSAAYSGNKGLRFSSVNTTASGNYNQTLITPELDGSDSMSVIFYVRASESTETFRVGYSTTGSAAANFNWQSPVTVGNNWLHYRYDIPASAKYVALNYFSGAPRHYLYVDSLVVTLNDGSVDCPEPTISSVSATATTITVNYSNLGPVQAGIVEGDVWDDATTAQNIPDGNSYTFTHLFSNNASLFDTTTYTIGLRAICGSDFSDWVTYTISTRQIICNDPTDLTADVLNGSTVALSWNGNGATEWEVNYSDGTNDNTITSTSSSVNLSGLTIGVTYTARVRAICAQHFSEWSNTVTFTPSDCLVPMGLSTSNITTTSAKIHWNEGDYSQWEIAYGPTGSFNLTYATHATVNTNEYTITGLLAGQNYTWTVRTICSEDEMSDWSSRVNFTTEGNPQGILDPESTTPSSQFSIHPNPASDKVNVTLNGVSGDATITIVDLNGRTVKKLEANSSKFVIDISDLPQGAYFVRASSNDGLNAVKKIIVK